MREQDPVRLLFNDEATRWHDLYAPGGSLARRIAMFEARLRAATPPPARLLEVGCGTGDLANGLALAGYEVTACDIAEEMLTAAQRNFPNPALRWLLLAPGPMRLPLPDASFDAVVASSVFEYIDNINRAFRECARVLRPGGALVLSVPNPANRNRRLEQALRPAAVILSDLPVSWPRRVRSGLRYLKLSKNRFPLSHWEAVARRADLHLVPAAIDRAEPLAVFTFRRGDPA